MSDPVNSPSHYISNGIECFDVIVASQGEEAAMNYCIGNAMKYVFRHNDKNGIEDIKKARWYINKYIELFENKDA